MDSVDHRSFFTQDYKTVGTFQFVIGIEKMHHSLVFCNGRVSTLTLSLQI